MSLFLVAVDQSVEGVESRCDLFFGERMCICDVCVPRKKSMFGKLCPQAAEMCAVVLARLQLLSDQVEHRPQESDVFLHPSADVTAALLPYWGSSDGGAASDWPAAVAVAAGVVTEQGRSEEGEGPLTRRCVPTLNRASEANQPASTSTHARTPSASVTDRKWSEGDGGSA
ncbi:unnamed protein product [Pleuronectes platessa]|uniref:Uncharacterized protein n=1 Tax=Pleuronectes platessa TaxID=8262 RepID=A0A9N7TVZ9_PLEPL|nr:unnamed protein product [Pleuronectes platessa]